MNTSVAPIVPARSVLAACLALLCPIGQLAAAPAAPVKVQTTSKPTTTAAPPAAAKPSVQSAPSLQATQVYKNAMQALERGDMASYQKLNQQYIQMRASETSAPPAPATTPVVTSRAATAPSGGAVSGTAAPGGSTAPAGSTLLPMWGALGAVNASNAASGQTSPAGTVGPAPAGSATSPPGSGVSTVPTWNTPNVAGGPDSSPAVLTTTPVWQTPAAPASVDATTSPAPGGVATVPVWNRPATAPSATAAPAGSFTAGSASASAEPSGNPFLAAPIWKTPAVNPPPASGTIPPPSLPATTPDAATPKRTQAEIEAFLASRPYREYDRDSGGRTVTRSSTLEVLTKEQLRKFNCGILAAMLARLTGKNAAMCQEVMQEKRCSSRTPPSAELAASAPPPTAAPSAPASVTAAPQGVIAKVAAAAVNALNYDEDLFKAAGLPPPHDAWIDQLMSNVLKGIDLQAKADSAYVKSDVESVADGLQGLSQPKATDPDRLSIDLGYAGPKPSSVAGRRYGGSSEGYQPAPMDLDKSGAPKPSPVLIHSLYSPNENSMADNATAYAVAAAQNEGKVAVTKKWDGRSPPQDGWTNDKGQRWSASLGAWVTEDIFLTEEKQRVVDQAKKETSAAQREKLWDQYYTNTAGPAYGSERYTAALLMQYKIDQTLEKYSTLSPNMKAGIKDAVQQAIITGASAEQLKAIAQEQLGAYVKKHEDVAQKAEAEADWEDTKITIYKVAASLTTAPLGVAGLIAETGLYTYAGYCEGNATKGLTEALWANVPGSNIYNWYKEYRAGTASSWGLLGATVFDSLIAAGTFATFADLKKGQLLGSAYTSTGLGLDGAKAGSVVDDALAAWSAAGKEEKGMLLARARGQTKVSEFNGLFGSAWGDGLRKGVFRLDDYPDVKQAAWMIQQDPAAIHVLNSMEPKTIENFNDTMKLMYKQVDDAIYRNLDSSSKLKYGSNYDFIEAVKPTNPKVADKIKAGFDQDITYRVHLKDGSVQDVPAAHLQKLVNQCSYDVAGKPSLRTFDPEGVGQMLLTKTGADGVKIPPAADEVFAFMGGQTATDQLSADAYGHSPFQLESVLHFKEEMFLGNMQYAATFAHKGNEWFAHAAKMAAAAQAAETAGNSARALSLLGYQSKFMEEGCRQLTKQWNGQAVPAMGKVIGACAELGLPWPKTPPVELNQAMELLGTIGKVDATSGRMIPASLVDFQVRKLGFGGLEDVGKKAADYVQAYEHCVKNNPALAENLAKKGTAARKAWNRDLTKPGKVLEADPTRI